MTLDGSGSSDPEGDALTFACVQTDGPSVTLGDADQATASFVGPAVAPGGKLLAFRLTVGDGELTDADTVSIHVQNASDPPNCEAALPSVNLLWPPDHKMQPVTIGNLADPEDGDVRIAVTRVTQDEPVGGRRRR